LVWAFNRSSVEFIVVGLDVLEKRIRPRGAAALSQSRIDVQGVIYVIKDPAATILED
jgi:hypothetical protein